MAMPESSDLRAPLRFRVRFRGTLDATWFATMQNAAQSTIRTGDATETTIEGEIPDQAALIGIVNMLYVLGCEFISVQAVDTDAASGATNAPAHSEL